MAARKRKRKPEHGDPHIDKLVSALIILLGLLVIASAYSLTGMAEQAAQTLWGTVSIVVGLALLAHHMRG